MFHNMVIVDSSSIDQCNSVYRRTLDT